MADITKCAGGDNPKCNTCYRKLAKVNEFAQRVAYFVQIPMLVDGSCEHYWDAIDFNEPKRDKAIAQNGNIGYEAE